MELVTTKSLELATNKMLELGMDVQQVKREISFAIQIFNKNEKLLDTSPESRLASVVNVANVGLTLNPVAKEAYLLPRYDKVTRKMICCLEPSYIGLVKLLTDSGAVTSMVANIVYEKDVFEIDLANNSNPITHKPCIFSKDKGAIMGVYALATLANGTRQSEWMDIDQVNEISDRSETHKAFKAGKIQSSTWHTDFAEMARKTVVKRIYKYLPRTKKHEIIDRAIDADNQDYSVTDGQVSFIESLLQNSTIDQRQRDLIEMELSVMNSKRASEVIEMLKDNQLDPVTHGYAASQTDIKKHLQKLA